MKEVKQKRLKLSTTKEIRQALTRISRMVLNEELDPKRASVIIYACNIILGSIRADDQQKRIEELETLIEERTSGKRTLTIAPHGATR